MIKCLSKNELTTDQLHAIEAFRNTLLNRGWVYDGSFNANFDDGWAVPYQAQLKGQISGGSLVVRYAWSHNDAHNKLLISLFKDGNSQTISFSSTGNIKTDLSVVIELEGLLKVYQVRELLKLSVNKYQDCKINYFDKFIPLTEKNLAKIYELNASQ